MTPMCVKSKTDGMRTTLNIDDKLLDAAKDQAALRGMTLGSYVEDAIRNHLSSPTATVPVPAIPLFTRGNGMRPSIDPASNRSMSDALDACGDLS
jgi:hypothetical protein